MSGKKVRGFLFTQTESLPPSFLDGGGRVGGNKSTFLNNNYFFESTVLKDYAAKNSTVALYHEYPKWDQNPWFISLSKMIGSVYYDAIKPLFNQ